MRNARWSSQIGGGTTRLKPEDDNACARDGFSRIGMGKLSAEAVAEAAELAAQGLPFEVVYYPRAGWSDFVVKAEVVEEALNVFWTSGMKVKMAMETEDSSRMTWFQGTVSAACVPDGNKLMGIVLCAVFVFRQHHPLHQLCIEDTGYMMITHHLRLTFVESNTSHIVLLSEEFGKIESYQLWLQYIPFNRSSDIEFKFEFEGPGLEVTKCGAHLVFERDIEDLINQTKAGSSGCIITHYDQHGFDDSEKDTKIKRSCDDSDGEWAGPSGEATSNDIDILHPKSVQLPNLFQRLMLCLGNWIGSLCAQRQGDSDCEEEEFQ